MNAELVNDLKDLAEKHGITYETLICYIRNMLDKEDRYEDIRYLLSSEYPEIADIEENVAYIYKRFVKAEDSEYGLWDNIRNAIEYVKDELIKRGEEDD